MKKFNKVVLISGASVVLGALLLIGGLLLGGKDGIRKIDEKYDFISFGYYNEKSMEYDFDKIEAISIVDSGAKVKIIEGDKFHVDVKYKDNMPEPKVKEENGKLLIEQKDIVFNFNFWNWKKDKIFSEIVITCPSGTELSSMRIEAAGYLHISKINSRETKLKVSGGNIDISDVNLGKLKAKAKWGNINMRAVTAEETELTADASDIQASFKEPIEAYEIDAKVTWGKLKVNGEIHPMFEERYKFKGSKGKNKILIKSELGNVDLEFLR